jgi:hypothetical protein
MGSIYQNDTYSYSFDNFCFLLLGSIDTFYPEIIEDLKTLYLARLDTNRIIDANLFSKAQQSYSPNQ